MTVGISDHAQDSLGEAVFVDMPDVGTRFDQGGTLVCSNSSICEHNVHALIIVLVTSWYCFLSLDLL